MPLLITHACVVPQGFESNALGAFGGGPESTEAWRKRVDAQDAFSATARRRRWWPGAPLWRSWRPP